MIGYIWIKIYSIFSFQSVTLVSLFGWSKRKNSTATSVDEYCLFFLFSHHIRLPWHYIETANKQLINRRSCHNTKTPKRVWYKNNWARIIIRNVVGSQENGSKFQRELRWHCGHFTLLFAPTIHVVCAFQWC